MNRDKLAYMANQIARSFEPLGEAPAITSTANHIRLFWDPRMRAELNALARGEGSALSPVARHAARSLAGEKIA